MPERRPNQSDEVTTIRSDTRQRTLVSRKGQSQQPAAVMAASVAVV